MKCNLCPRLCNVDRDINIGYCRALNQLQISWYGSHSGEEPPISGTKGSGTIFFLNCNLSCVFCQNWQISQNEISGKIYTHDDLLKVFFELQENGCHNINLVTPTIWTEQLIESIIKAKKQGLRIPIAWNSNAYENVETLKQLEGLVDIYLPDYKYSDDKISLKYSGAKNYSQFAKEAISEMHRQVGDLEIDDNGIAKKGLIVRHLVLPGQISNSRECLKYVSSISENIHLSLMSQYNPVFRSSDYPEINRTLNEKEYETILDAVASLGIKNGWIQEFGKSTNSLMPDFTRINPFAV